MKRKGTIFLGLAFLVFATIAWSVEKEEKAEVKAPHVIVKKMEPPSAKEQVEQWDKRLQKTESELRVQQQLREEAMTAAKKELEAAKKAVAAGKDEAANEALIKVRHHFKRLEDCDGDCEAMGGMKAFAAPMGSRKMIRIMKTDCGEGEECNIDINGILKECGVEGADCGTDCKVETSPDGKEKRVIIKKEMK